MDLSTVLKSSKLISTNIQSLIKNEYVVVALDNGTPLIITMDGNTPVYNISSDLLDMGVPVEEDTENETTFNYQGLLFKIKFLLKNARYNVFYEINNVPENEEIVSFIKENTEYAKVDIITKALFNVKLENIGDYTDTNYTHIEKNMIVSGNFKIESWDLYPKITNMTISNANTVKFKVSGIIEKVQIDM